MNPKRGDTLASGAGGFAAEVADGVVAASAVIDTLTKSLDEHGRAKPDSVRKVLDQVRELAVAVRG